MGFAMYVFGNMRRANAQISLRMRADWSGHSLSANRKRGYYRMYERRAKDRMILCACAGWYESVHFVHVRGHFFAWHGPYIYLWQSMSLKCITWPGKICRSTGWALSNDAYVVFLNRGISNMEESNSSMNQIHGGIKYMEKSNTWRSHTHRGIKYMKETNTSRNQIHGGIKYIEGSNTSRDQIHQWIKYIEESNTSRNQIHRVSIVMKNSNTWKNQIHREIK